MGEEGGGRVEGWVWPHGLNPTFDPTQCLSYLYVYGSRGLFSCKQCTVKEEKAAMKGYSRLGWVRLG
jgi:hypothetical protein